MRKICYWCGAILPDNSTVCLLCDYDNAGVKTPAEEEPQEEEEFDTSALPGETYKTCYNCGSLWIGTSLICPICGYDHQKDIKKEENPEENFEEEAEGEYYKICPFCNGRNDVSAVYCELCESSLENARTVKVKSADQIREARQQEAAEREAKILEEMKREQEDRKIERLKYKFLSRKKLENPKYVMTTTGSFFEGYESLDYVDLVYGETFVPERLFDAVSSGKYNLIASLEKAKGLATDAMKKAALEKGANGIVGITINQYDMKRGILVSASGTAVKIIPRNEEI